MTISLNRFGQRLKPLSICVRAQTKPTLERAAKNEAILKADRFRNILHRASWNRQACSGFVPVRSRGPPSPQGYWPLNFGCNAHARNRSRSFLRSAKISLQKRATLRNAAQISLPLVSSEKHAAQKPLFELQISRSGPTEICRRIYLNESVQQFA